MSIFASESIVSGRNAVQPVSVWPVRSRVAVAVVVIGAAGAATAHDAFASEFDTNRPVRLAGTVARTAWVTPRVSIYLNVPDADGTTGAWRIDGDAPYALTQRGWRQDSVVPGARLVVDGYQAKDGTAAACGRTVTLSDGRTLFLAWCGPVNTTKNASAPRIRYRSNRIEQVMMFAAQRSAGFRDLIALIEASQDRVYIEDRRCRSSYSCLHLIPASRSRYLSIHINPRQDTLLVVRQLAHELHHAVEIISAPSVVDSSSLVQLYKRIGFPGCSPHAPACWETRGAQAMERLVLNEIHRANWSLDVHPALFGTWKLNLEKSTFEPGSAPQEGVRVYGNRGYGLISVVSSIVDASGLGRRDAFVYRPDGNDYLVSAEPPLPRTITMSPIDALAADFIVKSGDQIVYTGRQTLDRRGRTMTVETLELDAHGQPRKSAAVWDKQPR